MAQQNHLSRAILSPILLSVVALFVWVAVAAYLLKWVRAWAAGRLEPGIESSWLGLYGMFAIAVVGLAGGVFLTIRAWQRKSTVGWQVFSILLGFLLLWAASGD